MSLFERTRAALRDAEKEAHRQRLVQLYGSIEKCRDALVIEAKNLDGVLDEIKGDVNFEGLEPARVDFWNQWWTAYYFVFGQYMLDYVARNQKKG